MHSVKRNIFTKFMIIIILSKENGEVEAKHPG